MALDYPTYVTTIQNLLAIADASGQTMLDAILPQMIAYAELRMYRELDLVDTIEAVTTQCVPNSRNIALPDGMIVVQSVNVITPADVAPDMGTRNACQRVSLPFLDFTSTPAGMAPQPETIPFYYARLDFSNVRLSFTPDDAYNVEFVGTIRPDPLSATNVTTILTTWFPDLFVSASMIFGAGYQRDFGTGANDPGMAQWWESQYQSQKQGADIEEARKKAMGPAWTPLSPTPLATPPRA